MPNLALKRKIGKFWPSQFENRKIILLYHSVGNGAWATSPQDFSDQINWLSDHCKIYSLTDLIYSESSPELQVAITFDDGYANLCDQATKLSEKKINPMIYINTGWMGESENKRKHSVPELGHYPNEYFLTWKEVKELYQLGWEIGSHGVNHYNFAEMKQEVTKQELIQSKYDIETQLNTLCSHFAYPWGRYSSKVKNIVKNAGYQYAAAARHGQLNMHSDYYSLPRINIERNYSFEDFKKIMIGKWDYLGLIHKIKGL
jgi:peptidoglycan/xylan/chitin deacetylase (PgdA/CDA1 family)